MLVSYFKINDISPIEIGLTQSQVVLSGYAQIRSRVRANSFAL